MAKFECERKFLLKENVWEFWRDKAKGSVRMVQGYLSRRKESTVRVRITDTRAWLTVKGITSGFTREEYEYEIPLEDAERMLLMCEGGTVEKIRYFFPWEGRTFEIDIFGGRHAGLELCEVELSSENEEVELPPFVGREVTGDPRYYNSNL